MCLFVVFCSVVGWKATSLRSSQLTRPWRLHAQKKANTRYFRRANKEFDFRPQLTNRERGGDIHATPFSSRRDCDAVGRTFFWEIQSSSCRSMQTTQRCREWGLPNESREPKSYKHKTMINSASGALFYDLRQSIFNLYFIRLWAREIKNIIYESIVS